MATQRMPGNVTSSGGLLQLSEGAGGAINVGGANARLLTGPTGRKVMAVELFLNLPVSASAATDTLIDLDLGDLEALGPFLESVTAHTLTQGITSSDFNWRVVYYTSYGGKKYYPTSGAPNDVFSVVSADGYAVQAALAPTNGFPLRMRFALAVKLASAGPAQSAVVSCTLVLVFRS